jgi:hypothetical protein
MRTIEISTEVFAKIWSQRISGEEDENTILGRLLGLKNSPLREEQKTFKIGTILWRQDVRESLKNLGGSGHLKDIYEQVRIIRRSKGRSVPANLDAIVRRELEYNSSDAGAYQGKRDWFKSVDGIGSGVWALREEASA